MAFADVPGLGIPMPGLVFQQANSLAFTSCTNLTALNHKVAFVGDFFHKDKTGSKNITKVHTRIGSNTSFSGTLTGYVQGVSTTSGPPANPDGSTTSGATFGTVTAATWQTTGTFSTPYVASVGDRLAVVLEITAFTSGSIAPASGLSGLGAVSGFAHAVQSITNPATTWSASSVNFIPNILLECDDGTFGTIGGCFVASAVGTVAYNSATAAADEYALEMSFPFPVKVSGCWALVNFGTSADFSFVLAGVSTQTKSIDYNQSAISGFGRYVFAHFAAPVQLNANTTYRLSLRPDTTNSVTISYFDVSSASHLQAHQFGEAWCQADRVDGGAWGKTNSNSGARRPMMGVIVSAFDDGTGGGGTTIAGTPLLRGMVG